MPAERQVPLTRTESTSINALSLLMRSTVDCGRPTDGSKNAIDGLGLALEAIALGRKCGGEDLDRHQSLEARVVGKVNLTHAAGPPAPLRSDSD